MAGPLQPVRCQVRTHEGTHSCAHARMQKCAHARAQTHKARSHALRTSTNLSKSRTRGPALGHIQPTPTCITKRMHVDGARRRRANDMRQCQHTNERWWVSGHGSLYTTDGVREGVRGRLCELRLNSRDSRLHVGESRVERASLAVIVDPHTVRQCLPLPHRLRESVAPDILS